MTTDPAPHLPHAAMGDDGQARGGLAIGEMLGVLRRNWAWILMPAALVAVLAVVFVQVVSPRYTAEAKLLLENRDPAFAKSASERSDQREQIDEQAVASQVQVVMSRDLAREAIRRLKLVGNPEFDPAGGEPGLIERLKMMLGLGKNPAERAPEDRVLDAYFNRLLVFPAGKSRILSVEFKAGDPELAANAANTIAELYIASLEAAKVDTARYASTWLGTNIETLRARVADAEAKVEAFRTKNNLIGSGGATSQPLGAQQLSELSSQLSQARTIKADLTARVKMLKEMIKDGRAFEIPDVANNDLVRRVVESRMSLRAQLALESRTLLPAHPRIKELTAQLNDLETQIKATAERIVRTMENDSKIAGARVESLQAAVDGQRDVVAQGNTSEVQLRALEREAKAQREQLESYLSRYREAAARDAESATPADARIISRAVVPETPSFPKKLPIVAFATVLALLLSAGTAIGLHLLKAPQPHASGNRVEPDFDEEPAREPAYAQDRFAYPEPMRPAAFARGGRVRASDEIAWGRDQDVDGRQAEPEPVLPEAVSDTSRDEAARMPVEPVVQPEPMPAPQKAAAVEAPPAQPAPAPAAAAPRAEEGGYNLHALIARLRNISGHGGRCVLVTEMTGAATGRTGHGLGCSLARTLSETTRTISIDINGRNVSPNEPGFTDLVAGEAAFLDVIHVAAGSKLHAVNPGFIDVDVLLEEPHGLAISLNAMAQAYDWVICRLDGTRPGVRDGLYPALATCMDSVIIVSNAEPNDDDLVTIYRLAEEAGAGQVLVARDLPAPKEPSDLSLRLSA